MTRFVRMKCPKCGGMYLKDGRCETCGFQIIEKPSVLKQAPMNQPDKFHPIDNQSVGNSTNLMQCPDCGKMISKDAISCPQCGCPFPGNEKGRDAQHVIVQKKSGVGFVGLLLAIVLGGLIIWYIVSPYSTPVWMQKIGGTIRCFFTGETSYKVFDPAGVLKK